MSKRYEVRQVSMTPGSTLQFWGVWDTAEERWVVPAAGWTTPTRYEKERNAQRAADALNSLQSESEKEVTHGDDTATSV